MSQSSIQVLHQFIDELGAGKSPDLETAAQSLNEGDHGEMLPIMIRHHATHCRQNGSDPKVDDYQFAMTWLSSERVQELVELTHGDVKAQNETNLRSAWDTSQQRELGVTEPASDASQIGSLLWKPPGKIGKFEIVGVVGHGSFGVVLEAKDVMIDRRVAIKIPKNAGRPHSEFVAEAKANGALYHPNIIPLFEFGIDNDLNIPYLVFPFVDGGDLGKLIETGVPMKPAAAVRLVIDIASAIQHAHVADLYHRDLKPKNILLDSAGRPYVSDFGMSLHVSAQRKQRREIAGTLAYMAPEQVRGESGLLDGRSDVWGLGVILYEMLSKRRPFTGSTEAEYRSAILNQSPRPLTQFSTNVPASLDGICRKCLRQSVDDRYASAGELVAALETWLREYELAASIATYEPQKPIDVQPPKPVLVETVSAKSYRFIVGWWWLSILPLMMAVVFGITSMTPKMDEPRRLAWHPGTTASTAKLDASESRLHLTSEYFAAGQIGRGEKDGFKFGGKLKNFGLGRYGIVWGWRQSPTHPGILTCLALIVQENHDTPEPDFHLEWAELQYDSQLGYVKRITGLGSTLPVGAEDRIGAIQFDVVNGEPTNILWNGKELRMRIAFPPRYVLPPNPDEGPIGFFVENASAELKDVQITPLK